MSGPIQITREKLVEQLQAINGATFIGVTTASVADLKKTGLPDSLKGVVKETHLTGSFGASYEKCLNRRLEANGEETREAGPLPWGEWDGRLVKHKGNYYIPMLPTTSESKFLKDGVEVDKALVQPFLPKKYASDCPWVMLSIAKIISVKMNGILYTLS